MVAAAAKREPAAIADDDITPELDVEVSLDSAADGALAEAVLDAEVVEEAVVAEDATDDGAPDDGVTDDGAPDDGADREPVTVDAG